MAKNEANKYHEQEENAKQTAMQAEKALSIEKDKEQKLESTEHELEAKEAKLQNEIITK